MSYLSCSSVSAEGRAERPGGDAGEKAGEVTGLRVMTAGKCRFLLSGVGRRDAGDNGTEIT